MSLEKKMNAREIVMEAGMSARPEYYSGRGATRSDLNDQILEKTYRAIEREQGEQAAGEFVQMVADIPKLSATDFLLTLYRLEGNEWNWDGRLLGNENGIDVGPDREDGVREVIGMMSIMHAMLGDNSRDETNYIRGKFLQRHGIEKPGFYQFLN